MQALDLGQVDTFTITLWEGTSFRARVQAYNALGVGPMSAGLHVGIPSSFASVPPAPGSRK